MHIFYNAGDALNSQHYGGNRNHENMPFSTPDADNDEWSQGNCAEVSKSATRIHNTATLEAILETFHSNL